MRRHQACLGVLTLLFFLVLKDFASAGTMVINYTSRGFYYSSGTAIPSGSYVAGDDRGDSNFSFSNDIRSYFVFDLSSVALPIESAKLALSQPANGFSSADPSESYELHDVVSPVSQLMFGVPGVAVHTDLGTGVVYGSRTITAADNGTVVEIELNAAAINALNSSHSLFAFGGSITTLDNVANNEYAFGFTFRGTEIIELQLTVVPEPSTLLLLGIVAINLLGNRRRTRS